MMTLEKQSEKDQWKKMVDKEESLHINQTSGLVRVNNGPIWVTSSF